MKCDYNPETMTMDVMAKFERSIAIPETGTTSQLREFHEVAKGIMINPTELISAAYERIFDQPYEPEEIPNEITD